MSRFCHRSQRRPRAPPARSPAASRPAPQPGPGHIVPSQLPRLPLPTILRSLGRSSMKSKARRVDVAARGSRRGAKRPPHCIEAAWLRPVVLVLLRRRAWTPRAALPRSATATAWSRSVRTLPRA